MADKNGASIWLRLLIIAYALGIVAIGAYPIQRDYGGIVEFLRGESALLASELRNRRAGVEDNEVERIRIRSLNAPQGEVAPPSAAGRGAKGDELDKLTTQDRAQLNKLIEGL